MILKKCDLCGEEAMEPTIGWRSLCYTSEVRTEEMDVGRMDFCSWRHLGLFASRKADFGGEPTQDENQE